MGYTYSTCGWITLKAIMFVLGTFVFSVIFWGTKKWMEHAPKKKKKK